MSFLHDRVSVEQGEGGELFIAKPQYLDIVQQVLASILLHLHH